MRRVCRLVALSAFAIAVVMGSVAYTETASLKMVTNVAHIHIGE